MNGYASKAPETLPGIQAAQAKAIVALEDWDRFLAVDVLPRAHRDFRIGSEFYQAKLRYILDSALTVDEIRRRAERDLKETQGAIYDTAAGLYTKMFPGKTDISDRKAVIRAVLDKLAEDRPDASTIMEQSRRELADATAFVRSRNRSDDLRYTVGDPSKCRSSSAASPWRTASAPGPLEKQWKHFLQHLSRRLQIGVRTGRILLPRVQRLHAQKPYGTRGDARSLSADGHREPV